jgi:NMD protein affecting ribosome stability and mRNA decay
VLCPECKAVFRDGAWEWRRPPRGALIRSCPACRRMLDGRPAGELRLNGPFFAEHEDEILDLVRNHAERARRSFPTHRLMDIDDEDESVVVRFTEAEMTREIGEAIENAFHGETWIDESTEDVEVRVTWTR